MTRLHGFAYGESLEGLPPRSLGYRLLTPCEPEPWCAEVESLARLLQAAPYPEHWPTTDLFCSVLVAEGRRLVAVARYGLADHTANPCRGGLELVGVVAPGGLGVLSAEAIYRWLRQQRARPTILRQLDGPDRLDQILTAVPPAALPAQVASAPPIPVRQERVQLFAAAEPSDPDQRLGLLDQGNADNWQWLPFVGSEFPGTFSQRGPLIAWTPQLSGVAAPLRCPAMETPDILIIGGGIIGCSRPANWAASARALLFLTVAASAAALPPPRPGCWHPRSRRARRGRSWIPCLDSVAGYEGWIRELQADVPAVSRLLPARLT